MRVAFFDTHRFDREAFIEGNRRCGNKHEFIFLEPTLSNQTAKLAAGYPCICVFTNDHVDSDVIGELAAGGLKLVALRCAGFNNVDLKAAAASQIKVVRVPAYSPHAVAEFAMALILSLNRKLHRAYARVRELNFSLDGLVGFDLFGRTIGIVGLGKIGSIFAQICKGFGLNVISHDPFAAPIAGVEPVDLKELYSRSDIISLHLPLTPETRHLIDQGSISQMKRGVMLINSGRGALIDTPALIDGLKSGQIGSAGLDVYEEEEGIFFKDCSSMILEDDVLARLLTFPNVLITSHQAFLTKDALRNIADTTLASISGFEENGQILNGVS